MTVATTLSTEDARGEATGKSAKAPELIAYSTEIGRDVADLCADDVDAAARFPEETLGACRQAKLMSALIPEELGGWGAPISEVAEGVAVLARHCASSAMILAMHHLQVACLVRHGDSSAIRRFVGEVARRQLLLASATTEINIGGQLRTSSCAVETSGGRFRLEKQAPVISYGDQADAVLVTARRHPEAVPSDQVLVICSPPEMELEAITSWDTLGMRGTCSSGFKIRAEGPVERILPQPFSAIADRTMLPVSHILWASVWLGIGADATRRARSHVQAAAHKSPGSTPLGATALAELVARYRQMKALVRGAIDRYEEQGTMGSLGDALASNSLKIAAATDVVDIVTRAMAVCGMHGYRNDSRYSVARHLRDAHGAVVMVSNDRILADNAHLLLMDREEL